MKIIFRHLMDAKEALKESESANQAKDQKIAELKEIVARLTTNNNDMLALLTQKVGLEDSLKLAKTANEELLHKLSLETEKNSTLNKKVEANEAEIQRLRTLISDLQTSLHSDLERVASRPPTQTGFRPKSKPVDSTVDLCLSEVEEPKGRKSSDNVDSAIHSESHPATSASSSTSNKQKALLEEAKNMLQKRQAAEKDINSFVPANLSLSETRDDTELSTGPLEDTTAVSVTANDARTPVNSKDMSGDVNAFLNRMRNQADLNLSLPKLPTAKSYEGGATCLQITGVDDDVTQTLSESRFRKGLETSFLGTSDYD